MWKGNAVIGRHEVWIFLGLIVVVNTAFVGAIGAGLLPKGLYNYGRFLLLGLTLLAVVLAGSGPAGALDLVRPMARWRLAPGWYLLALGWAAAVAVVVLAGKGLAAGTGLAEVKANLAVVARPRVMATVLIGSFIGEIVWVSYAVRRLSARFTPFVASQIVGVFWTLWWMPMVVLNIGVIPGLPPAALLVNMLGIAAMCAFVYVHTKSGLAVLILQVMVNSIALVLPVMPTTGGVPTYWAYALAYCAGVLALYLAFGPRPLLLQGQNRRVQA